MRQNKYFFWGPLWHFLYHFELSFVVCCFEALSEKHLRMHMQKEHELISSEIWDLEAKSVLWWIFSGIAHIDCSFEALSEKHLRMHMQREHELISSEIRDLEANWYSEVYLVTKFPKENHQFPVFWNWYFLGVWYYEQIQLIFKFL